MTRTLKQITAACLLGAFVPPTAAMAQSSGQSQQPEEIVKATHGDWQIVCPSAESTDCVMRQIGKTPDGQDVLIVLITKLDDVTAQDGRNVPAAIRILTPLGSILRAGVKVQVDASEPLTGGYEVCIPRGCVVEDPMSDELLGQFRAGSVAKMTFGIMQQGEVTVDISLNGFTKAFGSL